MAHSWIEAFPDELTAFRKWAEQYPDNSALLVDTYDVLNSGIPNAVTVFKELRAAGHEPVGIRIDSGTSRLYHKLPGHNWTRLAFPMPKSLFLTHWMNTSLPRCCTKAHRSIILVSVKSSSLSASAPVLSGVYKLAATESNGQSTPRSRSVPVAKTNDSW